MTIRSFPLQPSRDPKLGPLFSRVSPDVSNRFFSPHLSKINQDYAHKELILIMPDKTRLRADSRAKMVQNVRECVREYLQALRSNVVLCAPLFHDSVC